METDKSDENKKGFDFVFKEFVKMRTKMRKPLTDYAKELILRKLDRLADSEEEKILMLENSIERSWQSVFPLEGEWKKTSKKYVDKSNDFSDKFPSLR